MRHTKLVWTSDPEEARRLRETLSPGKTAADAQPSAQTIKVAVDKKRRAGKSVTVAGGFQLTAASLAALAAQLKKKCGAGGTAREAEIEIQGDHAETVTNELLTMGYKVRR